MEQILEQNYEAYLQTNLNPYLGEWVAICDNKIISHGENVKEVFSEAKKKCPNKRPLLTRILDKETMIF